MDGRRREENKIGVSQQLIGTGRCGRMEKLES